MDFAQSRSALTFVAALAVLALAGCSQARRSNVTPGAAKRHIQPGITTQAEVVEIFGSPNIMTRKEGKEMWIYDKISSRQTDNAFGIAGIGGDAGSAGLGVLGTGARRHSATRSETTVMLIVYFDEEDVVADYKVNQTKF